MKLVERQGYTREEIHSLLGGELVTYLPQKGSRITCGCFTAALRPDSPRVVLVGDAPEVVRKAKVLIRQGGSIPVFLKKDSNIWEFDGHYRVKNHSEDRELIEIKQREAGRDNVSLIIYMEPANPNTYLLTWNPREWLWTDLEDQARKTTEGERVINTWSAGNTKRIQPGDRLFLLRLGQDPKGIMGSGWATSGVEEGPHWKPERAAIGDERLRVWASFDHLLNPDRDELLSTDKLQAGPLASVHWFSQSSGIEIKAGIEELEHLWREHLSIVRPALDSAELSALEGEVRLMMIRHRSRERSLRDAKLDAYQTAHGGRLPCEACGFDFYEAYGEIGRGFAHVHHDRPLSELAEPTTTTLDDLRVICPNCHAMIHRGGECRDLETLFTQRIGQD